MFFAKQSKRQCMFVASLGVVILQTHVIHVARLGVLDTSGHGEPRNFFSFSLMPVRFKLHRLHDILSWTRSMTMSLPLCMSRNPPMSTNTFACSSEV